MLSLIIYYLSKLQLAPIFVVAVSTLCSLWRLKLINTVSFKRSLWSLLLFAMLAFGLLNLEVPEWNGPEFKEIPSGKRPEWLLNFLLKAAEIILSALKVLHSFLLKAAKSTLFTLTELTKIVSFCLYLCSELIKSIIETLWSIVPILSTLILKALFKISTWIGGIICLLVAKLFQNILNFWKNIPQQEEADSFESESEASDSDSNFLETHSPETPVLANIPSPLALQYDEEQVTTTVVTADLTEQESEGNPLTHLTETLQGDESNEPLSSSQTVLEESSERENLLLSVWPVLNNLLLLGSSVAPLLGIDLGVHAYGFIKACIALQQAVSASSLISLLKPAPRRSAPLLLQASAPLQVHSQTVELTPPSSILFNKIENLIEELKGEQLSHLLDSSSWALRALKRR